MRELRKIIKAPFRYAGSKRLSVRFIMKHLPYTRTWVEGFGGTGVVTLNREPSSFEVFNDTHAGVIAVYRCMKNKDKTARLDEWLEYALRSRETFESYRKDWIDAEDDVERAARWLYWVYYGFKGTNGILDVAGEKAHISVKSKLFPILHARLKNVLIENHDWRYILTTYDRPGTTFYLDPPYYNTSQSATYDVNTMRADEHTEMLDMIAKMRSFVAVSSYPNEIYPMRKFWDKVVSTEVASFSGPATEMLWIKNSTW